MLSVCLSLSFVAYSSSLFISFAFGDCVYAPLVRTQPNAYSFIASFVYFLYKYFVFVLFPFESQRSPPIKEHKLSDFSAASPDASNPSIRLSTFLSASLVFVVGICTWPFCHFHFYFHFDYALHYLHATLTFAITTRTAASFVSHWDYKYASYRTSWNRINMPATRWISYTTWIFNQSNERRTYICRCLKGGWSKKKLMTGGLLNRAAYAPDCICIHIIIYISYD